MAAYFWSICRIFFYMLRNRFFIRKEIYGKNELEARIFVQRLEELYQCIFCDSALPALQIYIYICICPLHSVSIWEVITKSLKMFSHFNKLNNGFFHVILFCSLLWKRGLNVLFSSSLNFDLDNTFLLANVSEIAWYIATKQNLTLSLMSPMKQRWS